MELVLKEISEQPVHVVFVPVPVSWRKKQTSGPGELLEQLSAAAALQHGIAHGPGKAIEDGRVHQEGEHLRFNPSEHLLAHILGQETIALTETAARRAGLRCVGRRPGLGERHQLEAGDPSLAGLVEFVQCGVIDRQATRAEQCPCLTARQRQVVGPDLAHLALHA